MEVRASDGCRLSVTVSGPAHEAPVLWLQGLNAPATAWAVQLAHFATTRRNIAPDARGVGASDAPKGPYTTAQLASDCIAILDALDVRSAHVVGLSLGGAVGQELALRHPERVRSLALLATFAAQPPRTRALMEAWRAFYPVAAQSEELRRAWEKQAYTWLFTDRFWRSEANVRAAMRFAASQPMQSVDGYLGQLDAAMAHDSRSRLPSLRIPVSVIHGALDQLSPVANADELARLIPNAGLVVLPDVGHAVNLEGQRVVHTALRALWARAG